MQIICDYIRPSPWEWDGIVGRIKWSTHGERSANQKISYSAAYSFHIARHNKWDIIYDAFLIFGKAWFDREREKIFKIHARNEEGKKCFCSGARRIEFRSGFIMNWIIFFSHNSFVPLLGAWNIKYFKANRIRPLYESWQRKNIKKAEFKIL